MRKLELAVCNIASLTLLSQPLSIAWVEAGKNALKVHVCILKFGGGGENELLFLLALLLDILFFLHDHKGYKYFFFSWSEIVVYYNSNGLKQTLQHMHSYLA